MLGLYQPDPKRNTPVTRWTLGKRKAKVVDAWRVEGELVQVLRDKHGRLYQGLANTDVHVPAFFPVVEAA